MLLQTMNITDRMSRSTFISALMCLFTMLSCSGNIDYNDPDNVPEGVLRIFADKTTIKADGTDQITFTVKFGSKDVSTDRNMNLIYIVGEDETSLKPGVNTFTTVTPSRYTFKARYYSGSAQYTDNEIVVDVLPAGQSVGQKDYYQKLWGMQFTAVSCTYCPELTASLKTIMSEDPDRIVLTAFHVIFDESTMPDPMRLSINEDFRAIVKHGDGLPLFSFNMYKSQDAIVDELDKIREQKQMMLVTYPATCGVALEAAYDKASSEVSVTGRVTSNVSESLRYHIFLVEDGVQYSQAGVSGTYVHDNVVRSVVAGNRWGDKLNSGVALEEGVEVSVTRTVKVDKSWNPSMMRAVFVVLSSHGDTYMCNNVNECAFDTSVDYRYN